MPSYLKSIGLALAVSLALGCQHRKVEHAQSITIYRWVFAEKQDKQLSSDSLFDLVQLTASEHYHGFKYLRSVRVIRNTEERTYSFNLQGTNTASDEALMAFKLKDADIVYFVSPDYF